MFEDVINNEKWSPGSCLIVDFSSLREFNTTKMDFPGISSVASYINRNRALFRDARIATLLRNTMNSKVVAGLMASLNDFYGSGIDHDIFLGHKEAVDWLKSR